jgi:hypothetical protein
VLAATAYLPLTAGFLGAAAAAVLTAFGLRLALNRSSAFLSRSSRACSSLQRVAVNVQVCSSSSSSSSSTLAGKTCRDTLLISLQAVHAQVCAAGQTWQEMFTMTDCKPVDAFVLLLLVTYALCVNIDPQHASAKVLRTTHLDTDLYYRVAAAEDRNEGT